MSCLMAYPPLGIAYHILEEYAVELRSDDIVFVNHGTLHRIEHLPLAVQHHQIGRAAGDQLVEAVLCVVLRMDPPLSGEPSAVWVPPSPVQVMRTDSMAGSEQRPKKRS